MRLRSKRHDHLSWKGNLEQTRYGWLRLTPAYSVHLVAELLDVHATPASRVLDPFCGTGTTALVCAERGIACDTTDINPFLLWLARAKTRTYTPADLVGLARGAAEVAQAMCATDEAWAPPLHQIEKWWDEATLRTLARAMAAIRALEAGKRASVAAADLLRVAFCRTMIERANVSFGHQSMSFKKPVASTRSRWPEDGQGVVEAWRRAVALIAGGAASRVAKRPRPILCDARALPNELEPDRYDCVVTSPPYPNRMSYIRELRPYMYWLGYLGDGRAAGELDWQAIGGTWGCATSNVARWQPEVPTEIPHRGFPALLKRIAGQGAKHSGLLSRYVHKYFHDMVAHVAGLFAVVAPGGTIHYVVGNSKFYDAMLPVERIFASLFAAAGFDETNVRVIRKRTSKKELYEFVVSARKPPRRARKR